MKFDKSPAVIFACFFAPNFYYSAFGKLFNKLFPPFLSCYSWLYNYGYHGQLFPHIFSQASHALNIVITVADYNIRVFGAEKQDTRVMGDKSFEFGDSRVGDTLISSMDLDNGRGRDKA